jgi:tRNA threonylcarbamoyladenosine biosynthesis protein TsaE
MANRKPFLEDLLTKPGVVCSSIGETMRLGAEIAAQMGTGSVLSLEGPLGAGKTQLTKGFVEAMGCTAEASSPSFALLHEYPGGRLPVFHFDFYRMERVEELDTAGYDDCLAEGVTIVEWGDKFSAVLPPGTLRLQLEILPGGTRAIKGSRTP